jgi:hypothetical protein
MSKNEPRHKFPCVPWEKFPLGQGCSTKDLKIFVQVLDEQERICKSGQNLHKFSKSCKISNIRKWGYGVKKTQVCFIR